MVHAKRQRLISPAKLLIVGFRISSAKEPTRRALPGRRDAQCAKNEFFQLGFPFPAIELITVPRW